MAYMEEESKKSGYMYVSNWFTSLFSRNQHRGFPGGSVVKNPLPVQEMQETQVQSLGWEDPLQ